MICIIDCGTSWLEEIKTSVGKAGFRLKVVKMEECAGRGFCEFSGIIISGSPILLTDAGSQKYLDNLEFVKKAKIPVLGICFGHQVIGMLYGAKAHIGEMIDKNEQVRVLEENGLFAGIAKEAVFREEHREFIDLPQGFELLAKSQTCANEAMRHKTKKLYGTQFHPEASGESGKKVLKNFLNMCGEK